jgi:CheY-like chemotaxis protein
MSAAAIKCPRCSAAITAAPDEMGVVVCPNCAARLRTRQSAVVKVQGAAPRPPSPPAPADIDSVLARLDGPPNPSATLPPGTPLKKIPRPGELGAPGTVTLEALFGELKTVRRLNEEILALLKARAESGAAEGLPDLPVMGGPVDDEPLSTPPAESEAPVRSRRRKSVLLIDDNESERKAALEALEKAQVPTKIAIDGNGGLAAIAIEKPDVIVMELDIGGSMAGKDVINMIKATMEWVDIPILLYTRMPIESQKEARTVHGADEFVLKDAGPEALVAKVISVFRKA